MRTIEEAIKKLEHLGIGNYYAKIYENSELRTNTEETVIYLKGQLENLMKCKGAKTVENCIANIETFIVGEENIGSSDFRNTNNKEYYCKEAINCCNEIIARIEATKPKEGDKLSVDELNEKYKYKFLIFNGDEDGEQIVFVQEIHYDKLNELVVDGVMIELCNENHQDGDGVLIYDIENYSFNTGFWYFGCFKNPHSADELDNALQSNPCDTSYPTHVIDAKTVALSIIRTISWTLDQKTGHIQLMNIFNKLESTIDKEQETDK